MAHTPKTQKGVVALILLGSACIMGSHVIKPNAVIPYPAVILWLAAMVLFGAALVMAVRNLTM